MGLWLDSPWWLQWFWIKQPATATTSCLTTRLKPQTALTHSMFHHMPTSQRFYVVFLLSVNLAPLWILPLKMSCCILSQMLFGYHLMNRLWSIYAVMFPVKNHERDGVINEVWDEGTVSSFNTGLYFSPVTLSFQQCKGRAQTTQLPQVKVRLFQWPSVRQSPRSNFGDQSTPSVSLFAPTATQWVYPIACCWSYPSHQPG